MKAKHLIILILITIVNKVIGQPSTEVEELFRKRHTISGMSYGHPYTTFDTHNLNYVDLPNAINNIRKRIIKEKGKPLAESPIFTAYQDIYKNATDPMPTDNGMPKNGISGLALWAKNNAFVFLIGLDSNGNYIDTGFSVATRNAFRDKAVSAFDHLNGNIDVPSTSPWLLTIPIAGALVYTSVYLKHLSDEQDYLGKIQEQCRSLTLWLQAYDLIKAEYATWELRFASTPRNKWGFGDYDRNTGKYSPRNKLRRLTSDLYHYSKGNFGIVEHKFGWKKNHGIAAASTLLLAAQVLNDAGVETDFFNTWYSYIPVLGWAVRAIAEPWPHPEYSPINWNELGQKGIEENLYKGEHWWPSSDVPQVERNTNADDASAYGEGPGYTDYGLLDNGLPAMRAQQNLYPDWTDEPFLKKNEIKNIFNWLDRISINQDGLLPSYDNTAVDKNSNKLCLTNNPNFYRGSTEGITYLLADVVAYIGGNKIQINNEPRKNFDAMLETGNLILRNKTAKAEHYFQMLCEKNKAVDISAYNDLPLFGTEGTHEDDDLASFVIYANDKGKQAVPLAIDPPYMGWDKVRKAKETNRYSMHNTIEIENYSSNFFFNPKYEFIKNDNVNSSNSIQSYNLNLDNFGYTGFISSSIKTNALIRNVNAIKSDDNLYYLINDNIDIDNTSATVKLNLNGHGNKEINDSYPSFSGLKTYRKENSCGLTVQWQPLLCVPTNNI